MKKIKILWRVRINKVWLCRIDWGRDRKRDAILCGTKRLREHEIRFSATFRKPHTLLIGWYQPASFFIPGYENSLKIVGYPGKTHIIM